MTLVSELWKLTVEIALGALITYIAEKKCCKELECFPLGQPWTSTYRPLPLLRCAEECPVSFLMFFRPNTSEMYNITWPETSFNNTPFDGSKPTVMYAAGHGYNWYDSWNLELKDLYLKRRDVNYIILDWERCNYDWMTSLATLRVFAAQAARVFKYLVKHHGAHPSRFHFIGHSWGAHIAAYTARYITGVQRLTGLDPALMLFWGTSKEIVINEMDAEFVEIGHTENIPVVGFGIPEPSGHVDYYFNGNWLQPSCILDASADSLRKSQENGYFDVVDYVIHMLTCGHIRALQYYIEALREPNCKFWGERLKPIINFFNALTGGTYAKNTTRLDQCDIGSCSPFGLETTEYPARGIFTIATATRSPYCIPNPEVDKKMAELLMEYKRNFFKNYHVNNLQR